MALQFERLGVAMLIALFLGLTEASLMHHHPFRAATEVSMLIGPEDATTPPKGRTATFGHVCAWCVVGVQSSEPPTANRWIQFSPTSSPLADPPAVVDLATSTRSISKRGPPAS